MQINVLLISNTQDHFLLQYYLSIYHCERNITTYEQYNSHTEVFLILLYVSVEIPLHTTGRTYTLSS